MVTSQEQANLTHRGLVLGSEYLRIPILEPIEITQTNTRIIYCRMLLVHSRTPLSKNLIRYLIVALLED